MICFKMVKRVLRIIGYGRLNVSILQHSMQVLIYHDERKFSSGVTVSTHSESSDTSSNLGKT